MEQFCIGLLLFMIQPESEAFLECFYPISITQEFMVTRPEGQVVMTCEITNVISSDVEFYWWLILERNEPIYTYSEIHEVKEVSWIHKAIFVNETTWSLEDRIFTQIILSTNVTDYNTYKCEFALKNDQVCRTSKKVNFEAAVVSMTYRTMEKHDEEPIIDVTCSINGAAGEPRFGILFHGDARERFEVLQENPIIENKNYNYDYYDGAYVVSVQMPPQGRLICQVNDSRGSYDSIIDIDLSDFLKVHISSSAGPSTVTIIAIIVSVVVLGAIIVTIFVLLKQRTQEIDISANTKQLQEGFPSLWGKHAYVIKSAIGNLHWTKIENITNYPVLFGKDGPCIDDIQQTIGAAADSWFLAALYSLLSSRHEKAQQYMKDIFNDVTDLTAPNIPLKLWRYGKWETISVEPTLPTKNGKLCYLHSKDNNVLWSAILQKAYYMNYFSTSELEFGPFRQVLQNLTGGLVDMVSGKDVSWYSLHEHVMTCQRKVGGHYVHYSVARAFMIEKYKQMVKLREFADISKKIDSPISTFPGELISQRFNDNEFCVTYEVFKQSFSHCCVLEPDDVCIYASDGRWERATTDDVNDGQFWANPQFLIETDRSLGIDVAVMQKPCHDKNDDQLLAPLWIGFIVFEITNTDFYPKFSITDIDNIKNHRNVEPKRTWEMIGSFTAYSNRSYIFVPYMQGGVFPMEFLFRLFVNEYEKGDIRVRRLHPAPIDEVWGNAQEEGTPLLSESEAHHVVSGEDKPLQTKSVSLDTTCDLKLSSGGALIESDDIEIVFD